MFPILRRPRPRAWPWYLGGAGFVCLALVVSWALAHDSGELRRFVGHDGPVLAVVFRPDGRTALSGGLDGTIREWDLASGRERRQLLGHTGPVSGLALSADGRRVLSGSWDLSL